MFDIIVQPPLYRLVVFPCLPHSLLISCLPFRLTHRIMHDCLCLRHQFCKTLGSWVFRLCFLCFLAQLRLRAHGTPFSISGNPPCIMSLIHIPLQLIYYTNPLRFHFQKLPKPYLRLSCLYNRMSSFCLSASLFLRSLFQYLLSPMN